MNSEKSIPEFFRRYRGLPILALAFLLAETAAATMIPTIPLYFGEHFRVKQELIIGLTMSAFAITEALAKPLVGRLGDRVGRARLLPYGFALGVATPWLLSAAASPKQFLCVRLIDGAMLATIWLSAMAMFADATAEEDRATAMSVFALCSMFGLGVGPALGTYLRDRTGGFHAVFVFISGMMALGLIVSVVSQRVLKASGTYSSTATKGASPKEKKTVIPWGRDLYVLCFLAFAQMAATSMMTPTGILFATKRLGADAGSLWKFFLGFAVLMGAAALPAGRFVDRIGKERALKIGMFCASGGLFLMLPATHPLAFVPGGLIYAFGFIIGWPAGLALMSRAAWAESRGAVMGVISAFQSIGVIVGPSAGTWLWDFGRRTGVGDDRLPFAACAAVLALCAVAAAIFIKPETTPSN